MYFTQTFVVNMSTEIIKALYTIIIWQSLFFAVVLFCSKYRKKFSNRFLALILAILGIDFLLNFLFGLQYISKLPNNTCSYGYLYGPLIYLYTTFYLHKDGKFKKSYYLHFVPFLFLFLTPLIDIDSCSFFSKLVIPTMLIYYLLSLKKIYVYRKTIPQVSTYTGQSETNWLFILILTDVLNCFLNLSQVYWGPFEIFHITIYPGFITLLGVLLFVNLIVIQGIRNPKVFLKISDSDLKLASFGTSKSNISEDDIKELEHVAKKAQEYVAREKIFTHPELDLNSLAKDLDVHPKMLSRAINRIMGHNFSDFINSYRIEEAKRLLSQPDRSDSSVKEVMYNVGFNSRSVFNTLFKKKTGKTPSQYRDHN